MRGNDFLDKMELIDPAYMEAAGVMPKKKKIWTGWRAAMAACICLVLLAGTAAAVSGGRTWLIEMFTDEETSSDVPTEYVLGAEIRKLPVSELPEEMLSAVNNDPSALPWCKDFSTAEEAWEFMGLDTLKKPDWDIGKTNGTRLYAWGDNSGEIRDITIGTVYELDDIVLQANTVIYTEHWDDEEGWMVRGFGEETEYTESFYTTPNGKQCQIISSAGPSDGRLRMDAYLADNGILYCWYVNYGSERDAAQAESLLHQWADMF